MPSKNALSSRYTRAPAGRNLEITEEDFTYQRREEAIAAEAALDGIYVVRTSVPETTLTAPQTVDAYKSLARVERAFRTYKGIDLRVRPVYHRLP